MRPNGHLLPLSSLLSASDLVTDTLDPGLIERSIYEQQVREDLRMDFFSERRFFVGIGEHRKVAFPIEAPFGVREVPTRQEQYALRHVSIRRSQFDPLDAIFFYITLSIAPLVSRQFVLRYSTFPEFQCRQAHSGLFVDGHEIESISEYTHNEKALLELLLSDRCASWDALHAEFETEFDAQRTAEIERRRRLLEKSDAAVQSALG